jgi:TRAP-type C4-dicarboxylate transport system permease small subunit
MFARTLCVMRKLSAAGMVAACALLVLAVAHVLLEVVLRSFFGRSTHVLEEFVGYALCAITFLSLAQAVNGGAMVRVSTLSALLGPRSKQCLEIATALAGLALTLLIAYYSWLSVSRNFRRGATSETVAAVPLWIPEGAMLVGLLLLAGSLALYVVDLILGRADIIETSESGN